MLLFLSIYLFLGIKDMRIHHNTSSRQLNGHLFSGKPNLLPFYTSYFGFSRTN
jgi:hypothetical protein